MMRHIAQSDLDIPSIIRSLEAGGVLVYPTETCYGIGCDATNEAAVKRVFDIKERQREKSVLIVFPHQHMAMEYVAWNPKLTELSDKYWPGPLTVVAQVKQGRTLPIGVVAPNGTIAFRISSHPLVELLTEQLGKPLVSTSANIASMESPYDIDSVVAMFDDKPNQPDMLIDAGSLPHHAPSTVISLDETGRYTVLRQGELIVE